MRAAEAGSIRVVTALVKNGASLEALGESICFSFWDRKFSYHF